MLYLELAEKGFFPMEEMHSLRQINSRLQGHPCSKETPGVEASTGPLGAGYPFALGLALSDMHDGVDAYTYAILGDGEINEGVVWETCMNASKFKADRLISILDWNGVQPVSYTHLDVYKRQEIACRMASASRGSELTG